MRAIFEASLLDNLSKIIARVMKRHENDPVRDPLAIAHEIFQESPPAIHALAAELQFRQMVRAELRHVHEDDSRNRQLAFPDFPLVQDSYPKANGSGYIKSEIMSDGDWWVNVQQLRRKGKKFLEHADQLEAWGRARFGWKLDREG